MAIGVGGGDLFDGDYTAEQMYYTSKENTKLQFKNSVLECYKSRAT